MKAEAGGPAQEAEAAFTAGQFDQARTLALAILADDPANPEALAVLAAVELVEKNPLKAREVAKKSFRLATEKEGKFTAARIAARASVDLEQTGIAKYWLRWAVQTAPTKDARSATVADFLALRSQSRLRFDVSLSVKPSDNVNQGADDDELTIDGRPTGFVFNASTMALSGFDTTANLSLRFRFAGTPVALTEVGFRAQLREVTLSSEANVLAPDAEGADFSTATIEAFLTHLLPLGERQNLSAGLTFGTSWLAREAYSDRARFDLALMTIHGKKTQSRVGFSVERQWLVTGGSSSTAVALDIGFQQSLASGDVALVKLEMAETVSDNANQENLRLGASLRYAFDKPIAGTRVSATLGVASRDYPVFFNGIFNDTGRKDLSISAKLDVAMPEFGVLGFEPVLSLEAHKTNSNVSRYTGQAVGIGLRIQSSF